ncbi:SRPBCC family protein [soil metagenome]
MPRMGSFRISRATTIAADPALVHRLVNDFHEWQTWSPWEGLDADLVRTYSGADRGVGAHYAWVGNRKAGEGSMAITGSDPEQIDVTLTFLKPWKASNEVTFELTPNHGATDVVWTMTGEHRGLMGALSKVIPMDKIVGKDFEKGLARLKGVAEA